MSCSIGVIGAGGWGTALAKVLADKGEHVALWCHGDDSFREITEYRENQTYLAGIILRAIIRAAGSLDEAVENKDLLICVLPSHDVRQELSQVDSKLVHAEPLLCGT